MSRVIRPRHVYKHFKGNYYYVEGLKRDSETQEMRVIYHQLYGDYDSWDRPYEMFAEELPVDKQEQYNQKYRFELVDFEKVVNPETLDL